MINPNFVFAGVFAQTLGGWSYLKDTIKGKIKPNKVSWLLWSLAPLIAFYAEIKQGVGIQSLTTFIVGFVPLLIFIASFLNKKAEWKLTAFDFVCGFLSITGLILWMITKVGNVAIFFSIIADGLGSLPTIKKSFLYPETENDWVYSTGVVNAVFGLLTIQQWNFQHFAFPIYLFFLNFLLVLLIRFKFGKIFRHG